MLTEILALDIERFFLIFTRLSGAFLFLPGFSSVNVPVRARLMLALAITLLLLPLVGSMYQPPSQVGSMIAYLAKEAMIGVFLGVVAQLLLSCLHVAGSIMGFQIGMANAFTMDAITQSQSSLLTTFLTQIGILLIFISNMHHLMLEALVESFTTFPPGDVLPVHDFADQVTLTVQSAFGFGVKLTAPMMAFGLIFYGGIGILSRLAPQIQIFFVAMPMQVFAGYWVLMVTLPILFFLFQRFFEEGLAPFALPG